MPQARDEAGNIWETDAQGNAIRLIQAAPSQQPKPITIGTPDPRIPLETAKAGNDLARSAATLPYEGAKAAADARKAAADATKAEMDAAASAKEQANAPRPETARIQSALQTDNVLSLLNTARQQIGKGWSTGNVAGTGAFQSIPFVGQNSTNLSGTLEGIQGNVINDTLKQLKAASANGASGYGSLTETEAQRLAAAVASLKQSQDTPTLLNNLATVERHYRSALALLNNEDPRDDAVAQKYGIIPAGDGAQTPQNQGMGAVTSEGRYEADPARAGVNAQVAKMIRSGKSAPEIKSYLNRVSPGLGDRAAQIDQSVQFYRLHPDIAPNVDLENKWVPASDMSRTLGEIGMSAPGSAVIGAGDLLSMGTLDNLAPNPDLARATMTGVQQENPTSYFLGQLGGGAAAGLGAELMLGKAGFGAVNAMRGGDMLTGAGYGMGTADAPDENRMMGGVLGAGGGLAGGMAGRGLSRAVGRAAAGVSDPLVQALDASGVRMTPGQILGGTAKRTEDRLAGIPVLGDQIQARRLEGYQDFNRAAMRDAVAPVAQVDAPAIGQNGVNNNQQIISDAYRTALDGKRFSADPQFISDVASALAYGRAIPQLGDQFDTVMNRRVGTLFGPQGEITGSGFQDALQGLRQARAATKNEVLGPEFAEGAGRVEDALRGLVQRQSPETLPAFDAANTAYRNQSVIDDAVLKALNTEGVFTPAQLGQAARSNTIKFGGKRAAARGDMPFNDLQQAAQEVLPSAIPDSGTAGRWIIPAVAGFGAGGGSYFSSEGEDRGSSSLGTGAVVAALASAPYSRGARAMIQKSLVGSRPEWMVNLGGQLVDKNAVAGLLARPYGNIYLTE